MKNPFTSSSILLIALVFLPGCQQKPAPVADYTPLAQAFIEVWNTGDVAVFDTLLHPDFVRHGPSTSVAGAEVAGIEDMKNAVFVTRAAVSEFDFRAEEIIAMDSVLVLRCRLSGIFNKTGKPFDVPSIHILKMEGGKIREHFSCLDHLDLYLQAGMKVVEPDAEP